MRFWIRRRSSASVTPVQSSDLGFEDEEDDEWWCFLELEDDLCLEEREADIFLEDSVSVSEPESSESLSEPELELELTELGPPESGDGFFSLELWCSSDDVTEMTGSDGATVWVGVARRSSSAG